MTRTPAPLAAIAVALAALAGFVDAVVFVRLGGYFAAFMSGNSTRVGAGLSLHDGAARWAAALILCFVCGVMLASVFARRFAKRPAAAVLLGVTVMLTLAATLDTLAASALALLAAAAAMGMQAGIARDDDAGIGLTAITLALVRFAQALAGAVWGARVATGYGEIALWIAAVAAGAITVAAAGVGAAARRVKVVSARPGGE